jgi:hypothetical protein
MVSDLKTVANKGCRIAAQKKKFVLGQIGIGNGKMGSEI